MSYMVSTKLNNQYLLNLKLSVTFFLSWYLKFALWLQPELDKLMYPQKKEEVLLENYHQLLKQTPCAFM